MSSTEFRSGPLQRSLWCDPLFLLIAGTGLALRWCLALQRPSLLLADADGYLAHAQSLLELGRYAGPYTGVSTAFRPPGFVFLLAIPLWLGFSSSAAVLAVQSLLSLCSFRATAALAELADLPRGMTLLAVAGVSCDPLLMLYSVQPMSEVPCAAVLSVALVWCVRSGFLAGVARSDAEGVTGVWRHQSFVAAFAGMLFAAGGLIRPAVLLAAAVCFLTGAVVWLKTIRRGRAGIRSAGGGEQANLTLVCVMACGFAAGLFPWVLRNALVFGSFIPATTHGGYTLALGNNPDFYRDVIHQPPGNDGNGFPWRGDRLESWQQRTLEEAALSGVRSGDEQALDRWYYHYALSSIRGDWSAFRRACVLRLWRFWAPTGTGTGAGVSGAVVTWLTCAWYLVWWVGLVAGLMFPGACGGGRRVEVLLWLCVLVFCGLHLVYWTDTRMRAPLMPLLIVLSCRGLWGGYQRTRSRSNWGRTAQESI